MTPAPHLDRLVAWFEALDPRGVERTGDYYADDAAFKDPFKEVRGVDAIAHIYARMFEQVDAPRFVVSKRIAQGDEAVLIWDMRFRFKGGRAEQTIHGSTHLVFDAAGKVVRHRDYWDTAEELYAKLPVLGALMRWLRRRAR